MKGYEDGAFAGFAQNPGNKYQGVQHDAVAAGSVDLRGQSVKDYLRNLAKRAVDAKKNLGLADGDGSSSTLVAALIDPSGKVSFLGMGDSMAAAWIVYDDGSVEARLLNKLHNDPYQAHVINEHISQESYDRIFRAGDNKFEGEIGHNQLGKKGKSVAKIIYAALSDGVVDVDGAPAGLDARQFLHEQTENFLSKYNADISRAVKDGRSAREISDAIVKAAPKVLGGGVIDNVSAAVAVVDPKNLPDKPVLLMAADGNGKNGKLVSGAIKNVFDEEFPAPDGSPGKKRSKSGVDQAQGPKEGRNAAKGITDDPIIYGAIVNRDGSATLEVSRGFRNEALEAWGIDPSSLKREAHPSDPGKAIITLSSEQVPAFMKGGSYRSPPRPTAPAGASRSANAHAAKITPGSFNNHSIHVEADGYRIKKSQAGGNGDAFLVLLPPPDTNELPWGMKLSDVPHSHRNPESPNARPFHDIYETSIDLMSEESGHKTIEPAHLNLTNEYGQPRLSPKDLIDRGYTPYVIAGPTGSFLDRNRGWGENPDGRVQGYNIDSQIKILQDMRWKGHAPEDIARAMAAKNLENGGTGGTIGIMEIKKDLQQEMSIVDGDVRISPSAVLAPKKELTKEFENRTGQGPGAAHETPALDPSSGRGITADAAEVHEVSSGLSKILKKGGVIATAVGGVIATGYAFADTGSFKEAGQACLEYVVPYAETAECAAEGDVSGAVSSAVIETAQNAGGAVGGLLTAGAMALVCAPPFGIATACVLGGAGLVGSIGGGMLAGEVTETVLKNGRDIAQSAMTKVGGLASSISGTATTAWAGLRGLFNKQETSEASEFVLAGGEEAGPESGEADTLRNILAGTSPEAVAEMGPEMQDRARLSSNPEEFALRFDELKKSNGLFLIPDQARLEFSQLAAKGDSGHTQAGNRDPEIETTVSAYNILNRAGSISPA